MSLQASQLHRARAHCLGYVALTTILAITGAASAAPQYTILDLGTFGGSSATSEAYGINDLGQVVGRAISDRDYYAFRTAPNTAINPATDNLGELGNLGDTGAVAIDNSGRVIGYASTPRGDHAFLTAPNAPVDLTHDDLDPLSYYSDCDALAINDLGQVVGGINSSGNFTAFRTAPYSAINLATDDLGTLRGDASTAFGINNAGQVVGRSTTILGYQHIFHAFRTAPNAAINPETDDLGNLGAPMSIATGINNLGQVIGVSSTASGKTHAFCTAPNAAINPATDDMGTLGGNYSEARAINDSGQVVGNSEISGNGNTHAFIYTDGVMLDLNDLIPAGSGWTLKYASDINKWGQIVGTGSFNGSPDRAFLLTPTPEPATLAMLAVGGLAMLRRRK